MWAEIKQSCWVCWLTKFDEFRSI